MTHPALVPDAVAVITGGASGIGLAAAKKLASLGLRVCIADLGADRLARARDQIAAVAKRGNVVMTSETDVGSRTALAQLEKAVLERFGSVDVLMNNAGIGPSTSILGPATNDDDWERLINVNLWGVIHGTRVFVPGMIERGKPGLIINTGSKQGITTPPGNPAYNVSKAGMKAFTEALAHELRTSPGGARITAHLLIPGFVWTDLATRGRTDLPKVPAAWTPEQTVDFMMERLDAGDFYILCPDNDVSRTVDERRIMWAAGDIIENRPALSRWHPDYAEAFKAFVAKP